MVVVYPPLFLPVFFSLRRLAEQRTHHVSILPLSSTRLHRSLWSRATRLPSFPTVLRQLILLLHRRIDRLLLPPSIQLCNSTTPNDYIVRDAFRFPSGLPGLCELFLDLHWNQREQAIPYRLISVHLLPALKACLSSIRALLHYYYYQQTIILHPFSAYILIDSPSII